MTGTSSEYLGRKPWPRVLRDRQVVFVVGPKGVGKSSVAKEIAGSKAIILDTRELQHAVLDRVRNGTWAPVVSQTEALVLDGPVWLRNRPGLVELIVQLLNDRAAARRRTVVCQSENDGSVERLLSAMDTGAHVMVGLRFPKGVRGRRRYARRLCDKLGLPREAADGTEALEPWRYEVVLDYLRRWPASRPPGVSASTTAEGPPAPWLQLGTERNG